jgi:Vitamin K epoxide reductase family/Thioredoxin
MASIEKSLHQWLKKMKVLIPFSYLKKRLVSHPDYSSIYSITCTLKELGIENAAIEVEKERLPEIPVPFLAYMNAKHDEDFILVENTNDVEKLYPGFIKRWTGKVIVAEKPDKIVKNDELKDIEKISRHNTNLWIIISSLLLFLTILSFIETSSVLYISLLLLSFIGTVITGSVVMQELEIKTVVSEKLCGRGREDCNAVIHSKLSKLPGAIKLSDMGVAFFSGSSFLLLWNSFTGKLFMNYGIQVIAFITCLSIPFTLFSIYYQWKVVRKWCNACLSVVGILWIMAILSILALEYTATGPRSFIHILTSVLLFFMPGALWLLIRPILNKTMKLNNENLQLLRFQRNDKLFISYLQQQRQVDTTAWKNDFQLGNAQAPLQLMVACSPFCAPCAKTHGLLNSLLETYKSKIGITIRFVIDISHKDEKNTLAIAHLLEYAHSRKDFFCHPEHAVHLLHDWFAHSNLDKFKSQYPIIEPLDINDLLEQHYHWSKNSKIQHTPTIFINGYELAAPYSIDFLAQFSEALVEYHFINAKETNEPFLISSLLEKIQISLEA